MNSESDQERTMLQLCIKYNRLNVLVSILESNDQDFSSIKQDDGNTLIHSATVLGRLQVILIIGMFFIFDTLCPIHFYTFSFWTSHSIVYVLKIVKFCNIKRSQHQLLSFTALITLYIKY